MHTVIYVISGMTCDHCVRAVTAEISELPGVAHVAVDLGAGTATVVADAPIDQESIRTAVDEAGYQLVGIR